MTSHCFYYIVDSFSKASAGALSVCVTIVGVSGDADVADRVVPLLLAPGSAL